MNSKTLAAMRALGTAPATPESDPPPAVPPFDGGARQSPPLAPETHDQWLVRVLRGEVAQSSRE
jgi:hypothetical protein